MHISRGTAIQSKSSNDYELEGKTVYRHLQDGDIVLVNRQPKLDKPSIMAHVVRVLKGEKTLRMRYANCRHLTIQILEGAGTLLTSTSMLLGILVSHYGYSVV